MIKGFRYLFIRSTFTENIYEMRAICECGELLGAPCSRTDSGDNLYRCEKCGREYELKLTLPEITRRDKRRLAPIDVIFR